MKALVLKEYNNLVYEEVPEPAYGKEEVLVQVKSCGICGSDVHGLDGSTGRRIPPVIMGHEAAGVIKEVGDNVTEWSSGDRVTFDSTLYRMDDWYTQRGQYNLSDHRQVLGVSCNEFKRDGAFAEYVAVPQHILHHVPKTVSFDQAAMTEPVSVAMHAVNLTPVTDDATALVIGSGMIGLFVVQVLKSRGCQKVIAVDVVDSQLDMATKFGADVTYNARETGVVEQIKRQTNDRGADVALEAVGITDAVTCAIEGVRKGGTVTLIGNVSKHINLPLQSVVSRQIRLQGSCAIGGECPEALELIAARKIIVDDVITASRPLSEGRKWFARLQKQEPGLMKVVLNP